MGCEINPKLTAMMKRGAEFLACEYPIICGAMTWVSEPNLVAAVTKAGCFACIAGGNSPVELLQKQIEDTAAMTGGRNFAVNLITIAPRYKEQLQLLAKMKMPYIVFAGSFPKGDEVKIAKESGAKVMCFASTVSIAERMIRYGADAIVLEGSESGGHIGHVSTTVLLQQVLFEVGDKTPVFVAGGIATGRMMAHMFLMGASGVQMGTRFVMTEECQVHPSFKDAFKRAEARDAMANPQFDSRLPVVSVRALRNDGTREFGKLQLKLIQQLEAGEIHREEAQMEVEKFWIGALRSAAIDGNVKSGSLMAGQSVGLVSDVMPVKALVAKMVAEAGAELDKVKAKLA